jgi:hypothetical protein
VLHERKIEQVVSLLQFSDEFAHVMTTPSGLFELPDVLNAEGKMPVAAAAVRRIAHDSLISHLPACRATAYSFEQQKLDFSL